MVFTEMLGVSDGTIVELTGGSVTGIVMFTEELGIVTETTVTLLEMVKLPPVGGMTTVSVTGTLDVMLVDGTGMLAEGVIWVKMPVRGVELAEIVELADCGGIDALGG